MQKKKLKNGLTVIFEKKPTKSMAIHITVKTGSNYESKQEAGISHFIEHMLFEGTKNRNAKKIADDIEGIGGEVGAFTSNTRTCFYVKALNKHFSKALDVLADMFKNSLFEDTAIEKERKVILSEIHLHRDEPRSYQWQLFLKSLFKKHPAKNPVIGNEKSIKSIKREDIVDYFEKRYSPSNIIISVAGNLKSPIRTINQKFGTIAKKAQKQISIPKEPSAPAKKLQIEKRSVGHSYLVLGFKTIPRNNKDSYTLDIIRAILGKGLSGRMFDEIRAKRGLAYEVTVTNDIDIDYGIFAVNISTDKKNLKVCQNLILEQCKNLDNIEKKEINEAKNYIEGEFVMHNEDTQELADELGFAEYISDANLVNKYVKKIRSVTKSKILIARDKYLKNNYAIAIIKQRK